MRTFAFLTSFSQSAQFFDLSFRCNIAFSNTCLHTQSAYIPSRYPHLINPFPLARSISLKLFQGHNLIFQTGFLRW
jgi:hypothetical protein